MAPIMLSTRGSRLARVNGATYLYATDLHNNKIDVFDTNFSKPVAMQGTVR
jgi:hypothetical protein